VKEMKIEEFENFYHVDIATQINNKWKDDTALGIDKESKKYSIMIRGRDKEIIKNRFILHNDLRVSRVHNCKVIVIVYSYLLYNLLLENKEADPILLCRDVRPERFVMNYLQKIASYFNNQEILNRKIKFRKKVEFDTLDKLPKSLAGKYVRKVYQGKIKPDKILNKEDIEELIEIISKII